MGINNRPTKVTDISSNNPNTYDYINGLKQQGSRFCFVKLTQGNWYLNSSASAQIINVLKAFNNTVGIYHYIDSSASINEQANYFLYWLGKFGITKDTEIMLDVEEDSLNDVTNKINQFVQILNSKGYMSIWIYSKDSWFSTNRINAHALKNVYIWTASYGAYPKIKNYDAWQYAGLTTQDWEYDYTGRLNAFKKQEANKTPYLQDGKKFQVITKNGLQGYTDLGFTKKHGNFLGYGSIIYGKIEKIGKISRLKTNVGYFSSNSNYLKKIE